MALLSSSAVPYKCKKESLELLALGKKYYLSFSDPYFILRFYVVSKVPLVTNIPAENPH